MTPIQKSKNSCDMNLVGEALDQLMTLDLRALGVAKQYYSLLRERATDSLSYRAAHFIERVLQPHRSVLLFTGFPVRPWVSPAIGETDGPPGTAALARALCLGYSVVPLVVTAQPFVDQVTAALRASGILVGTPEEAFQAAQGPRKLGMAGIISIGIGNLFTEHHAREILTKFQPALVTSIEHPGSNQAGIYHNAYGMDISSAMPNTDLLFRDIEEQKIPWVTFADRPNETGTRQLGERIAETERKFLSCVCGCSKGMTVRGRANEIVLGTTANWAAYATVGMLALLKKQKELCFRRNLEDAVIGALNLHGAIDTLSGQNDPAKGIDGVSLQASGHVLDWIEETVCRKIEQGDSS